MEASFDFRSAESSRVVIFLFLVQSDGMKPYERFKKSQLILRDELAIDRTLLANETTLLAYMRLSISLTIAGVSIVHFAMEEWFRTIGILCIPLGIGAGIVGWWRYNKMEKEIRSIRKKAR
jgi:putative membrane protein